MLINFNHLKTFYNALVHKMKAFRGNWNQNDPTADDYIKNRPFYDESKIITVLPEITVNVDYAYNSVDNPFKIKLEDGKTYTVIFDGSTYTSVAKSTDDNEPFIGNSSILGWNDNINTGEPFFIDVYNNTDVTFATTTPGKHTISVMYIDGVVHKLDSKYLPDDVVTTDNIPDNIVTADKLEEVLPDNLVISDDIADVVRYTEQSLTTEQQEQARTNIGAGTSNFSGSYDDLADKPNGLMSHRKLKWMNGDSRYDPYSACMFSDEIVAFAKYAGRCRLAHSTNGADWKYTSLNNDYISMASGPLRFATYGVNIVCCIGVSKEAFVYYDGGGQFNEVVPPVAAPGGSRWCSICFGDNKAVVISGDPYAEVFTNVDDYSSSVAAVCPRVDRRVDGEGNITYDYMWLETAMPATARWTRVAYGGDKFVAIARGTVAAYSLNGADWTASVLPIDAKWAWLTYDSTIGAFVAVSLEGHSAYSFDGITWVAHTEQNGSPFTGPIAGCGGKFISFSRTSYEKYFKYSDDGVNWFVSSTQLPVVKKWNSILVMNGAMAKCMCFPLTEGYTCNNIMSNDGLYWFDEVLTVDNAMKHEEVASAISPYISIEESNIPDTIARVSDIPEQVQPDWNQEDATHPSYIHNKPTLTGTSSATELPSDNILQANVMYFIGEVTNLSIGFPTTATMGDMVYISFSTGETIPTFTFTTNNHKGLNNINKLKNYNYELIGLWNGQEWMFAIHEVES